MRTSLTAQVHSRLIGSRRDAAHAWSAVGRSGGKEDLVPKNKEGQPLTSRVEALEAPHDNSGYMLAPPGEVDKSSIATGVGKDALREIKEWQAIMDHLRRLPVKNKGELPTIPVDERAAEVRAIKVG